MIFCYTLTLRRVVLDTIGTQMTRMKRIFADFFGDSSCNIRENSNKKSVKIRPIRVIRVPIVSQNNRA
jgi:hypothetical protein